LILITEANDFLPKGLINQAVFSQDKPAEMTGHHLAMLIRDYIRQIYRIFVQKGLGNK
jgi:hypothetical protein